MIKFTIFLLVAASLFFPSLVLSETTIKQINQPSIIIELLKEPADDKGTDVTNVYEVKVFDMTGQASQQYSVVYLFDGRVMEVFKNQNLPFSFKRNFKGQTRGSHEIKIIIEAPGDFLVASQTMTMEVR